MSALCRPYPDRVKVDGKTWELNLSLKNVLMAMEVPDAEGLLPTDAVQLQCAWLFRDPQRVPHDPALCSRILQAVFDLFPKPENDEREKVIDFEQDAPLIRSAFLRLGIDLTRDEIHFMQFLELLSDLPPDTALMRTVELRQRPVPEINEHNREQVARLLEAKQRVALKMTDAERRARFEKQIMRSSIYWG